MLTVFVFAAACNINIEVTNISDRMRQDRAIPGYVAGAIVRMVRINSGAARAGVQVGDIIQAVGDRLIQNVCGYEKALVTPLCDDVRLTVRRATSTIEIDVPRSTAGTKNGPHFSDQQACQNGAPAACTAMGRQYKAIDLFHLGCDLGDSEGCYLFAVNAGDNSPDARNAYRQACDDGNSLACTNLGWMLQSGHGGRIDLEESVRLYRRGCQGSSCNGPNNLGCVNLGRMLRDGIGVKADAVEATTIFRQVCDRAPINREDAGEIGRACSLAGTASLLGTGTAKNPHDALPLLEKGCDAGDSFGCFNLGITYENGSDVKRDLTRAMAYYKKACAAKDDEACQRLEKLSSR